MRYNCFLLLLSFFMVGCSDYERQPNCTLDKLNLHGNVVKVETIMQTTVPYTEMLADNHNPDAAMSMICGNVTLDFDNHGNIKKNTGYGIDGKQLFSVDDFTDVDIMSVSPSIIGISGNLDFDDIKVRKSINGKVTEADFMKNGKLIYKQDIGYDKSGNVKRITKNYEMQKIEIDNIVLETVDTTYFDYLKYDGHQNWTEARVVYKGIIPKQNDIYKIKRQITYDGEEHGDALINNLDEYNDESLQKPLSCNYKKVEMKNYGTISVPGFMVSKEVDKAIAESAAPKGSIKYICTYEYGNSNDAYASFLVSTSPNVNQVDFNDYTENDLQYDSEADKIFKNQYVSIMAQSKTYMLKWLPYKFEKISGKNALVIRYYRYGKNSPIPVYVESYTFSVFDGSYMTICYSFQSNMYNRFQQAFKKSIDTIAFY